MAYNDITPNGTKGIYKMETIKLQGISEKAAVKAGELKEGMVCVWNYGYRSEVVAVEFSKTGKTLTAKLRSLQDGIIRDRKMNANRIVAIEM